MREIMGTTVKKHEIDMLHGSIWNKLPLFALPVAATAILEQLFHASDVAIVGNFTGDARTVAVAAVGANGPIIGLIVNLFIGIALGANVVIANAIGCRDDNAVKRAVHTAIVFAVCGGAAVALLGQLIASPLLSILNVPEDVFPYALLYLRIYLLGMPVILLYNFEAAIFRSIGDTKVPLAALAISGVLNVLLNLFFVIVLHMTVNGVAIATVAANAVSAAFNVEILAYDVLNSFSQACTTFVGQNYGAGQIKRCKKTMQLSFLEGAIATFVSVVVLLLSARSLLAIFNSDPEVIAIGYIRLATILPAYVFCLIYEILSGYLRGFGISLAPALLTMLGVCGIRIAWVKFVFPTSMTFQTVMWVYPISLGVTAVLILCAVLIYRPSKRFASLETEETDK